MTSLRQHKTAPPDNCATKTLKNVLSFSLSHDPLSLWSVSQGPFVSLGIWLDVMEAWMLFPLPRVLGNRYITAAFPVFLLCSRHCYFYLDAPSSMAMTSLTLRDMPCRMQLCCLYGIAILRS